MRKTIILLQLLIICITGYAQVIPMKYLGVENGLSNNYVVDFAQDRQGCVWIATEAGLNRFDGKNLKAYTTAGSDIVSDELNTLWFDNEENTLWIGTQRKGISLFNCTTQSFDHLTTDEGLATNDVTHISAAADGGIWITHYHIGVEHYDKQTKQLTLYADNDIKGMKSFNSCSLDDGKGNLLIGHLLDGLSIVNLQTRTARNLQHDPQDPYSLPDNSVRCIYMDRFENIWIDTYNGLALFDPRTDRFITFRHDSRDPSSLGSNNINSIREMKDGTLWMSTDMAGISILNLSQFTFRDQQIRFRNIIASNDANGLSSANVKCIFQDSFENIWIGHHQQGINFISNSHQVFRTLPYGTGNAQGKTNTKPVWSMCIDNNRRIWVGGESELSLFQDDKLIKSIDMSLYLPNIHRYINAMKCDSKGYLWLGIYQGGVLKFNTETFRTESDLTDLLDNMSVRDFFEDTDGKMWISTEAGLYSYSDHTFRYEDKINNQLKDKVIFSFTRDRQGRIWVGTFGEGIHIFDPDGNLIEILSTSNGFCSNAINHLYVDSRGSIWVATRNGLVQMTDSADCSEFAVYSTKNGIENPHIRAVQEDSNGDIWVSTNTGISCLNKSESKFDNFNYQDGVPLGNFINEAACAAPDGDIYFASPNGICHFNPAEMMKDNRITPVEIISLHGFNRNIENQSEEITLPSEKKTIRLPYNWNSFRITFAIPNYAQSEQIEYTYTMDGLEKIWYNITNENQVTFRNIPPGEYTFRVKAKLKNQEWDETTLATLPIRIYPPMWLTWYAKLLYILVICITGYALLRSYNNKLKLKASLELEKRNSQNKQGLNEERLRFYTNVTHELRTPLTLILGPLEDLLYDAQLPEVFKKKIDIIHASAIRLLNLINQILEFRKTETQNRKLTVKKGDLASLIMETGLRYKELNTNEKVSFKTCIETEDTVLYFDADMISTILNNLLSNALKYTPEGEVKLIMRSVKVEDRPYTEVEVSDTGYGIDSDDLPRIFDRYYQAKSKYQASGTGIGLSLVKSLVELHGGKLWVKSVIGKGSCFIFRLLTDNTYPDALHADDRSPLPEVPVAIERAEMEEGNDGLPIALVIEDNADILAYIASSLADAFEVITATNGKEGLEKAQQSIPNIIISDIMTPEMNGIDFCAAVKKDVRTSHIPVILLTAKDSIQDREEGYESGADSYLTKPFSAKLLKSRILNLLEGRKKLATQILSQTKNNVEDSEKQPTIEMNKLDKDFLSKLTSIIEDNLQNEKLDITFLKERIHMSNSTLYRKLKGLTGLSPNEFVRKFRLRKAVNLLLSGEHNVSETAFLTGFSDSNYFRFCFKEEYGLTPSEYIKKYR